MYQLLIEEQSVLVESIGKGAGMIKNLLKTGVNLGSRFLGFAFGQKIAKEGIKNILRTCNAGVKRTSNKKIKRALESELAKCIKEYQIFK